MSILMSDHQSPSQNARPLKAGAAPFCIGSYATRKTNTYQPVRTRATGAVVMNFKSSPSPARRVGDIAGTPLHSTSSCSAALIRISGFPLYISIRPVILTCFPSMPDSRGDLLTGDAGKNQFQGVCPKCGANGPKRQSHQEALRAWNGRE